MCNVVPWEIFQGAYTYSEQCRWKTRVEKPTAHSRSTFSMSKDVGRAQAVSESQCPSMAPFEERAVCTQIAYTSRVRTETGRTRQTSSIFP
jgi:hypothetical protein